jgi:hypothetical protein
MVYRITDSMIAVNVMTTESTDSMIATVHRFTIVVV